MTRRGSLVTVVSQGDFGKPKPALVIQSNQFEEQASVTVLPLTSTLVDAPLLRLTIEPDQKNGLTKISQIMIDKALTIPREKIGNDIGKASSEIMISVNRLLALFLGIAP